MRSSSSFGSLLSSFAEWVAYFLTRTTDIHCCHHVTCILYVKDVWFSHAYLAKVSYVLGRVLFLVDALCRTCKKKSLVFISWIYTLYIMNDYCGQRGITTCRHFDHKRLNKSHNAEVLRGKETYNCSNNVYFTF